ncbi:MAG: hypothetical protein ACI9J5_001907 [Paraglaciecola sp.]
MFAGVYRLDADIYLKSLKLPLGAKGAQPHAVRLTKCNAVSDRGE